MSRVITFYNHKGGVAKTTNIFNFAYFSAESGKKTLIIDADPQCNATELFLARTIEQLDLTEYETGIEQDINGTSLLDILKPRIEGAAPEVDIEKVQVVPIAENLDLIKGDVSLTSIEDSLAEAHSQRHSTKIHERRTYCAIGDFLTRLGQKRNYDYIFIDVGPSSGALTRSCFLACDAFFIPVNPDRFDVQAITTLSAIIDRWMAEHIATEVPDFGSLAPIMQEFGKPVYNISREDTKSATLTGQAWGGGTWKDAQRRMNDYKKAYELMFKRLELIL